MHLTCEPVADERLRIKVTDTGLGVPPEAVERLFVPFEAVASERSAIEGAGLGLPLSKRLAEAMGDTLEGTVASGDHSNWRPPPESRNAIGDARIGCFEHFWQSSGREAAPICYPPTASSGQMQQCPAAGLSVLPPNGVTADTADSSTGDGGPYEIMGLWVERWRTAGSPVVSVMAAMGKAVL